MAIIQAYVSRHDQHEEARQLGRVFHVQLACPNIGRAFDSLVRVNLIREGDSYSAYWRGHARVVVECKKCAIMPEFTNHWQGEAACRGIDADMITPSSLEAQGLITEYCDGCPVRADCGDYALIRPDESFGIWGGVFLPQALSSYFRHVREKGFQRLEEERARLTSGDAA